MTNEEWLDKDRSFLSKVLPRVYDIVASHGEGSILYDVDGNSYLDFTSGIATNSTGHCHPQVVQAIQEQAGRLLHTSVVTHNEPTIQLAERLAGTVPFFEDPQVFFCNSGAEAVDGALKLARMATGKSGVIAFKGAFHGRTLAATSLTSAKEKYWRGYQPLLPGVHLAPYGDQPRLSLSVIKSILSRRVIGAVIVEPILGEGGYIVPDLEWLQQLRTLCYRQGILLIFDEVQTGVGRTGNWWAAETFGVTPDVILFAKGIASGLPLGGIIAPSSIMGRWPTGTHGSTFGGNPVSCAAALATLEIVEPLLPRVRERGQQILDRLSYDAPAKLEYNVQGVGYMVGLGMASSSDVLELRASCLNDGLLILSCGTDDNIIRLCPALTISDSDLEQGIAILQRNLRRLAK